MTPVVFRHPSSLEHDTGGHPEQPARIAAIERLLDERDWLGWEPRLSPPAERAQLDAVHAPEHVDAIERFCAAGGGMLDLDTVASPGTWEAALHAAGGAVALVDELLGEGDVRAGASLHRPPGHHAEPARAMGFCFFGNAAIGARHALDRHGAERVMILDWDVHHGNGTNDIFHTDPDVLFVSIHQSPLYPGTGPASDVGAGAGEGYTVNLPVAAGSGDDVYCALVEHVAVPLAREYAPRLILLSAGFDAHAEDPIGECTVSDQGYATMAASMRRVAGELGVPVGVVLEGGYALDALARGVAVTLEQVGSETPQARDVASHPVADEAAARVARHWPSLAG
jgi:acetoin utilization deacetylase AcuC-like enzyme